MKPTSNSGDDELKDTAASVSSPVKPVASNESILSLTHEESIYPTLASERVFVIFMSNVWEELRLYRQRIGDPMNHGYVHWDYHVIVAMKPSQSIIKEQCRCVENEIERDESGLPPATLCPCLGWIYDLDTTLPFPCSIQQYASEAFRAHLAPPMIRVPSNSYDSPSSSALRPYTRLFRVIGGRDFLLNFASDRRHMLVNPSIVENCIRAKSEEGVMRYDDGITSRKEIAQEVAHQEAEKESWKKSAVKDRLPSLGNDENDGDDGLNSARSMVSLNNVIPLEYLAPPPPYPPIRSSHSRHNLDDYRLFTHPDSGRGVVMDQDEFLQFFHCQIKPAPKIHKKQGKAKYQPK